jgi:FkbM family methyltransferase
MRQEPVLVNRSLPLLRVRLGFSGYRALGCVRGSLVFGLPKETTMQLRRTRHWFSTERLRACKRLFRRPLQAFLGLAFVTRRPVRLTLADGNSLLFTRSGRDHMFWDWYLRHGAGRVEFTSGGEILLTYGDWKVLLRPGTADFYSFREIFLQDAYGLKTLPARLGTVLDLGGNVGLFTCAVLPRAGRVITVEPVQANFQQAAKNLALNGGKATDLVRYAVTGRSGDQITLLLSSRNTCKHSLYAGLVEAGGIEGRETVPTITLPDLLTRAGCDDIDLLKCDIEGAEFDVFTATPVPVLRRIHRLIMEVHLSPEHPRSAFNALTDRLARAGFVLDFEHTGRRGANELGILRGQRKAQGTFARAG